MDAAIRRFTLVVLIVLLMATLVNARDYEIKGNAGNYVMDVKFDKNPPGKREQSCGNRGFRCCFQ